MPSFREGHRHDGTSGLVFTAMTLRFMSVSDRIASAAVRCNA
jgi:hypothetical protein